MADVEAPGTWATFHGTGGDWVGVEQRLRVLEAVNDAYVVVAGDDGRQFALMVAHGWWSDPDGPLPAVLLTAPPGA